MYTNSLIHICVYVYILIQLREYRYICERICTVTILALFFFFHPPTLTELMRVAKNP